MKLSIGLMTLALLISICLTAQDSVNNAALTGSYRAALDSNITFNIKMENNRLVLEISGQGQTLLLPQGGRRYKPEHVQPATVVEFIPDGNGQVQQFHWLQDMNLEMIKMAGDNSAGSHAGRYQLKNNPYVIVHIKEQEGGLVIQQGNSMPLIMRALGTDHFEYEKDGFRLRYDFTRDAQNAVREIKIARTGPQVFVRQTAATPLPYAGRDFMKRRDFTRADSLQGYLYPERSCYDVLFYSLDVHVLPETKSVAGHNTIRFKAVQPFQKMQIDLFAGMQIDKILYHNQPLTYAREYNAVFIQLPQPLKIGAIDSLTIHYAGQPRQPDLSKWQGGFFWLRDKNGNPWIQSVCQGSGASLWWPCKDHLSDEPDSMRIAITVPDSLTEISNGKLMGVASLPGKLMRYDWYVHYPINVYNVVVNLGKFDHYSEKYVNGRDTMALHFYYIDYHKDLAKQVFRDMQPMLRLYEKHFGRYPFHKDGFTIMESLYPMEHQGAISVGAFNNPFYSDQYDTAEIIRLAWHEAAHEWWGNNISCKDNADIWIHEAFATYAEILCYETFHGRDAVVKYLREQKPDNRASLIGFYDVNDFHLGDVYSKGSRLVYMLRQIINNEKQWQNLLRDLQEHFRYKTITSKEFEDYIIRFTRKDLKPVFDQYLRHTALPELELKFEQKGASLEVRYKWKADVVGFNMPVKVTTGKGKWEMIYPTQDVKILMVPAMQAEDFAVDTDAFLIKVQKN